MAKPNPPASKIAKPRRATSSAAVRSAEPIKPLVDGSPTASRKAGDYSALPLFLWFPEGDRTSLAGVLRKSYKAHSNTALGFIRSKLHPMASADGAWDPSAERHEVVLPCAAHDGGRDPFLLGTEFDRHVLPHKQSLLVYLTMRFPTSASLQRSWEIGRAFALRNLALKRKLATVMVQHAPHRAGSDNHQHLHLLVLPRRLTSLGFGVFDDAITTDAGLEKLYGEWRTFLRRWD